MSVHAMLLQRMNVVLDFTLQPQMPALERRAEVWTLEEKCNFGGHLYNSLYWAITMAMLRGAGPEKTYRIHIDLLRHHQKHFFLGGLRKLGLDLEQSDAVRCAKYHCFSNALGGLRTGYAIENPKKVWLFYFPHTPDNVWPGAATVANSKEYMMSDYRGWHGNNGAALGNPGLRFVATHFVCNGDPYDCGYFEDTGRVLAPNELVLERPGELPPSNLKLCRTELDPSQWPPERKMKALRNYAVSWAADRVKSALDLGADEGGLIAQRGIQFVLYGWMPRFRAAVGGAKEPAAEISAFLELFHSVAGISSQKKAIPNGWELTVQKSLGEFVGGSESPADQAAISRVVSESWRTVARQMGCTLEVNDSGTCWVVRS